MRQPISRQENSACLGGITLGAGPGPARVPCTRPSVNRIGSIPGRGPTPQVPGKPGRHLRSGVHHAGRARRSAPPATLSGCVYSAVTWIAALRARVRWIKGSIKLLAPLRETEPWALPETNLHECRGDGLPLPLLIEQKRLHGLHCLGDQCPLRTCQHLMELLYLPRCKRQHRAAEGLR